MFDILIMASEEHFHNLPSLYDSVVENISGYNEIHCICPVYPDDLIDGIKYHLDEDVLHRSSFQIPIRKNWINQQYIKLFQEVTIDNYVVIDADVLIGDPITMIEDNKPNFFLTWLKFPQFFYNYNKEMFDIEKEHELSFISEIMYFKRYLIKELISTKFDSKEEFMKVSNNTININCFLSEYELYGNYIYKSHNHLYNYKNVSVITNKRIKIIKQVKNT